MKDQAYVWRVGDVFTNGMYRWAVDSVYGEKAVLRSCGSSWATTKPLTFDEWREGGRWRLEVDGPPKDEGELETELSADAAGEALQDAYERVMARCG